MAQKARSIAFVIAFFSFSGILATAQSVTNLSPNSGPRGAWVTITGSNFGSTQGTSSVTFNGTAATTFQSWSASSIVVAVPPGTTTGNVVVTVSSIQSNGVAFTEFTTPPIPQVVQVQPANAGTGVPLNGRVVVRFAQAVPAISVVSGILTLSHGSTAVSGSVAQSNDGLSLTFIPTSNLAATTSYTVSVQDIAGGASSPQFQSSFTTGSTTDTTAPQIVQMSPAHGASGAPINAPLILQLTKRVDPSTVTPQALSITDQTTNSTVVGMVQVDATGLTASFIPQASLGAGRNFVSSILGAPIRDSSGNALTGSSSFSFNTGFTTDTQGPTLLALSPANNATGVPLNAQIVLEFDRPVNGASVLAGFQVQTGGQAVAGGTALSDSNKRIVFTPTGGLTASTTYSVVTTAQITDVAGYGLANPSTYVFTSGTSNDATTPSVSTVSPASAAVGVPNNAIIQLQFSKAIDLITATTSTFQVYPSATSVPIAGAITVAGNRLTATFTPAMALVPTTSYTVKATNGITDMEGHGLTVYTSGFTTGSGTSTTAPTVLSVSPSNGLTGIPVNARVDVVFSAAISAASVGSASIMLTAGGQPVSESITLSSDRMSATFTPASSLATSTAYTFTVAGVTDQTGNPVPTFTSSFTTGSSGTANTTKPSVVSVSPTSAATGVAVTSTIALTFNEPIDFKTVNNSTVSITLASTGAGLAGSYALDSTGKIVTFTPLTPLPGNSTIDVTLNTNGVVDICGNIGTSFSSWFRTAAISDTTPPSLTSITPTNGATNVGLNSQVVLTFSESLNPATVSTSGSPNIALFANSNKISASPSISADNRTVTLSPSSLPPNSTIEVFATSALTDLSGNSLPSFSSLFSTGAGLDSTNAMVLTQRPGNGATSVPLTSNIVLYVNEPMNVSTLSNALHVSQNGIVISGLRKSQNPAR